MISAYQLRYGEHLDIEPRLGFKISIDIMIQQEKIETVIDPKLLSFVLRRLAQKLRRPRRREMIEGRTCTTLVLYLGRMGRLSHACMCSVSASELEFHVDRPPFHVDSSRFVLALDECDFSILKDGSQ